MPDRAFALNPTILVWARERAGFTVDEAAEAVRRPADVLKAWESGEGAPTYRQLERLAVKYRRPVALFFFPEPPPEKDLKREFRTIPGPEFEGFEPDTKLALRQGLFWQTSLTELTGGKNPAERLITRDIHATPSEPVAELAAQVRAYLGPDLELQQSWRGHTIAFKEWRAALEAVGVFIFKRSFEQRSISGFCLHDVEFPIIVVNNSTAFARQIFTLFHELAHLLFGISGITNEQINYGSEAPKDLQLEIACNRFASEFLLPEEEFPWQLIDPRQTELSVVEIADLYNVSREVVLRRLLDQGRTSRETYRTLVTKWNEEFYRGRAQGSGGNYYATQASYLGDRYLQIAFSQFHSGRISLPELADHLGMKARNIGRFEDYVYSRRSA